MTETTDLLNSGEVVEALGCAYTLSHLTPKIRGAFSAWLKARARQGLLDERREGSLDGDAYRECLTLLTEEIAAGSYNWGSPLDPNGMGSAVRAALGQTEGKVRLVQLLLEPRHGILDGAKVLDLLAANPEGMQEALALCMAPAGNVRTLEKTTPGTNGTATG